MQTTLQTHARHWFVVAFPLGWWICAQLLTVSTRSPWWPTVHEDSSRVRRQTGSETEGGTGNHEKLTRQQYTWHDWKLRLHCWGIWDRPRHCPLPFKTQTSIRLAWASEPYLPFKSRVWRRDRTKGFSPRHMPLLQGLGKTLTWQITIIF